jgi:DNA repair protein RecO (recombination protein O)
MDWIDDGIVLSARKHGEAAAIVTLLTRSHGRHAGMVRGGAGSRARGLYQPGNLLRASWRARLSEHLGNYSCELMRSHAAAVLDDPLPLLALSAACAMVDAALPEREPHATLFESLSALVGGLGREGWAARYVRWELSFLAELGFGLDLSCCAATGVSDGLAFVSPKSGRAVSAGAGAPYADRLLALPAFLLAESGEPPARRDLAAGLKLTGFFLASHVFTPERRSLPAARERLLMAFAA